MSKFDKRIAAGMALLDEIKPGWEHEIDLDALKLSSCEMCVVGQLAGNAWQAGLPAILPPGRRTTREWPIKYGFGLSDDESLDGEYPILTEAWKVAIHARRQPA